MPIAPIRLPVIHYPFPAAQHSDAATIDDRTRAWAAHFELVPAATAVQRLRAARVGWLAACLAPAAAPQTVQLLADWTTWAILWDDYCDYPLVQQQPEQLAQESRTLLAVLRGQQRPDPDAPRACSIGDVRQRLMHAATPPQVHAFSRTVEAFFAGCLWEVTNRATAHVPDVASYRAMRPQASGMATAIELVISVEPIALPAAIRAHPQVRQLEACATMIVCWANDLLSLPKELACGDVHNLVVVLQHAEQLSLQDAVDRVGAWHDAAVSAFVAAERALPACVPSVAAPLQQYGDLLRSCIRGNHDWSVALSARYHAADRPDPHDGTDTCAFASSAPRHREVGA